MRRSPSSRKLWTVTALVVFLFFIDVVSHGTVRNLVRQGAGAVSHSVTSVFDAVGGRALFSSRAALEAQNAALSQQVADLQARVGYAAVLETENDNLRALTQLAQTTHGLTAPVVSSVISSPYGTFLIGAGAQDGVRAGDVVLAAAASPQDGFIVGVLSDVGAHTSTVEELFAPHAAINASLKAGAIVLSGSGGGNAHGILPRDTPVQTGDAVFVPQYNDRVAGIVGAVASTSASATEDIYVSLPVNLGALQFVYVVTS